MNLAAKIFKWNSMWKYFVPSLDFFLLDIFIALFIISLTSPPDLLISIIRRVPET